MTRTLSNHIANNDVAVTKFTWIMLNQNKNALDISGRNQRVPMQKLTKKWGKSIPEWTK